jgi:transcriptional regulator with XRE-family HTH domain
MRNKEPVPDPDRRGDRPDQEPLGQVPDAAHDLWSRPSVTIAEAARMCGISTSTIRRYLSAGRFPTAQQLPGPLPGRGASWRIPTQELLAADLRPDRARTPDQEQPYRPSSRRTAGQPVDDRVRELEHALELERLQRQAVEKLAAERAHTIQTLESALRALQGHQAAPAPEHDRALPRQARSNESYAAGPASGPGMLPMVPRRRPGKRELSQEEKAAIIGRALTRQRPPKRRWL